MDILNPRLRARRLGGYWDFWIYYTAVFTPTELGSVFADRVEYWEYDPDYWDKLGSSDWDFFTPRNQLEDIEWKLTVHEDVVDTEWGDEEVRGRVYLARPGTNGIHRDTPIVEDIDA
jgi:hypothetical protein